MVVIRYKRKYVEYGDDGRVLIITSHKNIARQIIKDYKNES